MHTQLRYPAPARRTVAKVAHRKPFEAHKDPGLRLPVAKARKPLRKGFANETSVTYKSHHSKCHRPCRKAIVRDAIAAGVRKITMEDLKHIRSRSKTGKRVRARHRFECEQRGLRAHADLNASRNLARIGGGCPARVACEDTDTPWHKSVLERRGLANTRVY